jgi:hypothetical protein
MVRFISAPLIRGSAMSRDSPQRIAFGYCGGTLIAWGVVTSYRELRSHFIGFFV